MIWFLNNPLWLICLALAMPLALLIDKFMGEPPMRLHPVVWMGHLLGWIGQRLPSGPPTRAFTAGTLGWFSGALLSVLIACLAQIVLLGLLMNTQLLSVASASESNGMLFVRLNQILMVAGVSLLIAILLKPMLSLRLLLEEGIAVENAIARSLTAGRKQTARICSRDTSAMDATALRETAVESLSENFADSVVAPLFWFTIAGLPGAALYRWANTADAMWGYRNAQYEWSGKFAACCDDVLNWLPARLSAVALWPVGQEKKLRLEAKRTPSPNGGWPMAATALILGVCLRKPGVYVLNTEGRLVDNTDIARTAKLVTRASWDSVAGMVFMLALTIISYRILLA